MASRSPYLERLAEIPALRHCSHRTLARVAQLVDEVVVTPGTPLDVPARQVTITLEPTRMLVVDRRALPALRELVPELLDAAPVVRARDQRLRLIPACFPSSA